MSDKDLQKYIDEMKSASQQSGVESIIQTNAGMFQMGDVFEAETTKGTKNYVIFMFVKDNFAYYFHGDRAKKVRVDTFQKLIDYGDLDPVAPHKRDPERMSLAVLGLNAMSHGLSFNDYVNVMYGNGKGSEVRGVGQF